MNVVRFETAQVGSAYFRNCLYDRNSDCHGELK